MKNFAPLSIFFVYLVLFFVAVGGWIANIVKIISIINDPVTIMLILRAVGIFFVPLGAVLGFI